MIGETQVQLNKMLKNRQIEVVPPAHREEVTLNPLNLLIVCFLVCFSIHFWLSADSFSYQIFEMIFLKLV